MRLRFSIRDGLLVTAIAAVACGWWADRQRLIREHEATREELRSARDDLDHPPWTDLAHAKTEAWKWKSMALVFAQEMRDEGWYVSVDGDDWSFSLNPPSAYADRPGMAQTLNKLSPLPD